MHEVTSGKHVRPDPRDFLGMAKSAPRPPLQQECFELDEEALWDFISSQGRSAPFGLLQNFFADLCYTTSVDSRVFLYLLPYALDMWSASLAGDRDALHGAGEFHSALFRKSSSLRALMGPHTEDALVRFMVATLNWFIKARPSSLQHPTLDWLPHWVGATCGLPRLASAWFQEMESLASPELISCYLIYISRFAYRHAENPLFSSAYEGPEPWTRTVFITGGICWQSESLDSARDHLSSARVRSCLESARVAYADDLVDMIASDMLVRMTSIEARVPEALRNLAVADPPVYWSDAF